LCTNKKPTIHYTSNNMINQHLLLSKMTESATSITTGTINMNPMTNAQLIFAYTSLYILFPLLYIIISTGNITPLMLIWQYMKSGIFNAVNRIKEFITDVTYFVLRVFGQYSFSTYTVVQNGREIYKSTSLFYYYPSNELTVYKIDRAKYNVCKWIDTQCKQYRHQNNGEEPEITESHNDIYDFILHKVENQPYTRIHRGNFTGRTHTLVSEHYRPFCKSYQLSGTAELTVTMPKYDNDIKRTETNAETNAETKTETETETETETKKETFMIELKKNNHFFVEKNQILDKKFLQWKLYNEFGRKDIANYIGMPFSNYSVNLYYNNLPSNLSLDATNNTVDTRNVALHITDSNFLLIGKRYAVKVDSVLRCPVYEENGKQVLDIDCVLSNCYSESETESNDDSDNDSDSDNNNDNNNNNDNDNDNDKNDNDNGDGDKKNHTTEVNKLEPSESESTSLCEDEFEMLN